MNSINATYAHKHDATKAARKALGNPEAKPSVDFEIVQTVGGRWTFESIAKVGAVALADVEKEPIVLAPVGRPYRGEGGPSNVDRAVKAMTKKEQRAADDKARIVAVFSDPKVESHFNRQGQAVAASPFAAEHAVSVREDKAPTKGAVKALAVAHRREERIARREAKAEAVKAAREARNASVKTLGAITVRVPTRNPDRLSPKNAIIWSMISREGGATEREIANALGWQFALVNCKRVATLKGVTIVAEGRGLDKRIRIA